MVHRGNFLAVQFALAPRFGDKENMLNSFQPCESGDCTRKRKSVRSKMHIRRAEFDFQFIDMQFIVARWRIDGNIKSKRVYRKAIGWSDIFGLGAKRHRLCQLSSFFIYFAPTDSRRIDCMCIGLCSNASSSDTLHIHLNVKRKINLRPNYFVCSGNGCKLCVIVYCIYACRTSNREWMT